MPRVTNWDALPLVMTLEEVASEVLGVDKETAYKMADKGELPTFRWSERTCRVSKNALRQKIEGIEIKYVRLKRVI